MSCTRYEVEPGPRDTVQCISWSPVANYFSAASWDGETRIWEVLNDGRSVPKTSIKHQAPALSTGWSLDGTKVIASGCDKMGRLLDLQTGQTIEILAHDEPVSACRFIQMPETNIPIILTGSWDKKIKFWDMRQQMPVHTYQLGERCICLDTAGLLLAIAASNSKIIIFSLRNPYQPYKTMDSPQKYQARSIGCLIDAKGFCLGTIEGRCQIQYIEPCTSTSFSFKCHRTDASTINSVNTVAFHPVHGTFATGGGDCAYYFWDKDSKQKLKGFAPVNAPITASAFNKDGDIFAFASGYDWYKGYQADQVEIIPKIMIQPVKPDEVAPKNPDNKKK